MVHMDLEVDHDMIMWPGGGDDGDVDQWGFLWYQPIQWKYCGNLIATAISDESRFLCSFICYVWLIRGHLATLRFDNDANVRDDDTSQMFGIKTKNGRERKRGKKSLFWGTKMAKWFANLCVNTMHRPSRTNTKGDWSSSLIGHDEEEEEGEVASDQV